MRGARAVPPQPGIDAELDFGKADLGLGVVGHDAAIAPHGQFGAAADATAVDGRHGDEREMRQPLKQLAAAGRQLDLVGA